MSRRAGRALRAAGIGTSRGFPDGRPYGVDNVTAVGVMMISGTGTDVGKTVVTAAVAALARAAGRRVAVVKPAQTGVLPQDPGDLAEVRRLSGVTDLHEYARYPDPLSPEAAARHRGMLEPDLDEAARRIRTLAEARDLVLVEGAGGLLVRFTASGGTIADLARALHAPVLVVAAAELGTLNATALTLEALATRGLACAGVVVGSWPRHPGLAARCNLTDLATVADRPLAGALAEGAGRLDTKSFASVAAGGLEPALGGGFDAAAFIEGVSPAALDGPASPRVPLPS